MTTTGYNIYFYYFYRVENSMKPLGECLPKGHLTMNMTTIEINKNLIGACKGL